MHPVLFEIQGFPIRSYGLALTLAFAVGIAVAYVRAGRSGIDRERILDVCIVILVSSLVGSRLLYAATHPDEFRAPHGTWTMIFDPSRSELGAQGIVGMSMTGGVVLATVCALLFMRLRGLPLLGTADLLAPSVPLGEGITRLGCFLNGCCHGTPCAWPWCVQFPAGSEASLRFGEASVHATQLYTSVLSFALAVALLAFARRRPRPGAVFFAFLTGIGAERVLVDLLRAYDPGDVLAHPFGVQLSVHSAIAMGLLLAGLIGLAVVARAPRAAVSR